MEYGNQILRSTYAEIKDVEEEHVTMYESLADPNESLYEKLLLHEFTEVCNYYTCYEDEVDNMMKPVWEEFLATEIAHLQEAAKLFKKYEKRDPEEVIGNKIVIPNHFESQKEYVKNILENEVDKRLGTNKDYKVISKLPDDWASYAIQAKSNELGSPTETTIKTIKVQKGRDIALADEKLVKKQPELLKRGLEDKSQAPDTVSVEEYELMTKKVFDF